MRILVTAGNTQVPIDKVRCLTNIFTGRTGGTIALHAHEAGHDVVLTTSNPLAIPMVMSGGKAIVPDRWTCCAYRTFDELHYQLEQQVRQGAFDVVIHCAAVSDYVSGGIYSPAEGTRFRSDDYRWQTVDGKPATLVDRAAGKVKSDEPELWLRLLRAPKLVDMIRSAWRFRGVLVKFKLEVGVSDDRLLATAESSRLHSEANLMVANTLEGMHEWAYLGPVRGRYERVTRIELPARLLEAAQTCHEEKSHG